MMVNQKVTDLGIPSTQLNLIALVMGQLPRQVNREELAHPLREPLCLGNCSQ
jgi:hypothetical protein